MTPPVLLHGLLANHRRGQILHEALAAEAVTTLPNSGAAVITFADNFQGADASEQVRLVEWTRTPGRLLLLVPPFAPGACEQPVSWRAERMESTPRSSEGLSKVLASEVTHRLDGKLQTPAAPGATWSDLSVCTGTYRLHPAAGLFAVTCLPLWSLTVLDALDSLNDWLESLVKLAGETKPKAPPTERPLLPDHYGLLVFLLSQDFVDEELAIAALLSSTVFRFSHEKARALLKELHDRGLVEGATPTTEATQLVMQSPYATYVSALREVSP